MHALLKNICGKNHRLLYKVATSIIEDRKMSQSDAFRISMRQAKRQVSLLRPLNIHKMPSCVFRWCTNYESKVNKTQGVSYHMFPIDQVRCQEWISIVRKQRNEFDWVPSRSSTVCTNHFKRSDTYLSKTGRTLLKKDAVPVKFKSKKKNIKNLSRNPDMENISEVENFLESPTVTALITRARQLLLEKKQLQKLNDSIALQNVMLKKCVVSLAVILNDLKEKDYMAKGKFSRLKLNVKVLD